MSTFGYTDSGRSCTYSPLGAASGESTAPGELPVLWRQGKQGGKDFILPKSNRSQKRGSPTDLTPCISELKLFYTEVQYCVRAKQLCSGVSFFLKLHLKKLILVTGLSPELCTSIHGENTGNRLYPQRTDLYTSSVKRSGSGIMGHSSWSGTWRRHQDGTPQWPAPS